MSIVHRQSPIANRKLNLPPPRISFIISFSAIINEEYAMPLLTQNTLFYGGLKRFASLLCDTHVEAPPSADFMHGFPLRPPTQTPHKYV
jgi:hypothetical protein